MKSRGGRSGGFWLRRMRDADLLAVTEVEESAYPHPWSRDIFLDCLRAGYGCWVGESSGTIVAHGILTVAVGESHILNVCVHPHWQGRGLGRRLLRHLLMQAIEGGAETAFLEVRASNTVAQALYASEGFQEISIRRGYYPSDAGREDAVILSCDLLDGLRTR